MKCPKCKRVFLRQQVNVFVDCDSRCHNLSKSGIRNADVKIQGVGWNMATIYCPRANCGYILNLNSGKQLRQK